MSRPAVGSYGGVVSYERGTPVQVKIGGGTVITGMEEGMKGMCKVSRPSYQFTSHTVSIKWF